METFWVLASYAVVVGGGRLGGLVFYYWLFVVPDVVRANSARPRPLR